MVWSLLSILHYVSMPERKKMLGRKNEGFSFSQEKKKERKWIQSQSVNGSRNDTASTSNIELNPSIPAKICDRAENQQLEMKLVLEL